MPTPRNSVTNVTTLPIGTPMLHGDDRYVKTGPDEWEASYGYTVTDRDVTAVLVSGGRIVEKVG